MIGLSAFGFVVWNGGGRHLAMRRQKFYLSVHIGIYNIVYYYIISVYNNSLSVACTCNNSLILPNDTILLGVKVYFVQTLHNLPRQTSTSVHTWLDSTRDPTPLLQRRANHKACHAHAHRFIQGASAKELSLLSRSQTGCTLFLLEASGNVTSLAETKSKVRPKRKIRTHRVDPHIPGTFEES